MIFVSPLKATLDVESQPSWNCSDRGFPRPNGSKSLWLSGKIWEENRLTCWKNITLSPKDGDSLSKFTRSSHGSRSSKRLCKGSQTSWRSRNEAFWLTNTCFQSWWRTTVTWTRASTRFSRVYTRVSSRWHQRKRPRSFTCDAALRSVLKGPSKGWDRRKTRFLWNTWKRFTLSTKIGLRTMTARRCSSWTRPMISRMMNTKLTTWSCSWETLLTTDGWSKVFYIYRLFFWINPRTFLVGNS